MYQKVIKSGNIIDVYEYEKPPVHNQKQKRRIEGLDSLPGLSLHREDTFNSPEQQKVRRKRNARSAVLAFRRLILCNLDESASPVLASLTYAENMQELSKGRKDFGAFTRTLKNRFGKQIRYICVPEFQKRGALHFHALIWGIPSEVVRTERDTRMVASLWGQGFVDLIQTDGSERLSSYLAKYMSKSFTDERLYSKKAYISSYNLKRPITDKNAILLPYFYGNLLEYPDLSTAQLLQNKSYMTQWLGECNYKQYRLNKHESTETKNS